LDDLPLQLCGGLTRATHAAVDRDEANSYLPFQGHLALREAACAHVAAITGRSYDPGTQCVSVAGGLIGILNVLLAFL
jgi:aspartate/methionine/tyrosine aminotransferase